MLGGVASGTGGFRRGAARSSTAPPSLPARFQPAPGSPASPPCGICPFLNEDPRFASFFFSPWRCEFYFFSRVFWTLKENGVKVPAGRTEPASPARPMKHRPDEVSPGRGGRRSNNRGRGQKRAAPSPPEPRAPACRTGPGCEAPLRVGEERAVRRSRPAGTSCCGLSRAVP